MIHVKTSVLTRILLDKRQRLGTEEKYLLRITCFKKVDSPADWFEHFTYHSVQIALWRSATRSLRKTIKIINFFEKPLRINYERLVLTSSNQLEPPVHRIAWDIVQISHGLGQQFFIYPYVKQILFQSQMKTGNVSILRHMVQLKPDQLRQFFRKTSKREIITRICEWLLKVVDRNVPVKIANIQQFETAYNYLITLKTSVVKTRAVFWLKKISI